jgi:fatty acid desaturase
MIHTEKMPLKRPPIPPEWFLPSLIGLVAYVTYALVLYTVPALLARAVVLMPLPLPVAIILMILLIWLAAKGVFLLAWLGHESFHLSLHRNKFFSALIGVFFASALPTYFEIGAAISHWNHHRYTNQASDPDCQLFEQFQGFWSSLFFARSAANLKYLTNTLKMAFNQPLDYSYKFHFKERGVVMLA